jgi:small GTP-binding protein
MISTGVNGLDEILGGGIPRGSKVLYSLEPGVDGQLFMISSLSCSLAKGLSCMVILPNATVDAFRNDAITKCGSRLDLTKGPVFFLDAIDRERIQKCARTPEAQARELQVRIRKICEENKVDVIFTYLDLMAEDFGLDTAIQILESCRTDSKTTLFIEHLNLDGAPLLDRFIKDFSFDLVIAVKSSFRPVPHFNYFTIVHTSWYPSPVRSVPFIIAEQRIVSYIPKIVITGPARSGKSTFVSNAAEKGYSVDRISPEGDPTTVAMDYGRLRWKDFDITLYGTPGHTRFDSLIPQALQHAMGAVLVIDATKPDTLGRAGELLNRITKQKIPVVVAANKNDLPAGMDPESIRKQLKLAKDVPVFSISAKRSSDVHRVLESLVDYITQYAY